MLHKQVDNTSPVDKDEANHLSGFLAGFLFLAGLLLGSLVGAGVMLLVAPQSGKRTRAQIRRRAREMRKESAETVDGAVAQARAKAHQVSTSLHEQAEELQHRGQDVLDEGKERLSVVVEAGKTVIHGA